MSDTIEDRAREYVDEWGLEDYEDEALAALLPMIRAEVAKAYEDAAALALAAHWMRGEKAGDVHDRVAARIRERAKEVAGE